MRKIQYYFKTIVYKNRTTLEIPSMHPADLLNHPNQLLPRQLNLFEFRRSSENFVHLLVR